LWACCQPAVADDVDVQTGLPIGAALARAHHGLALRVFGLAGPTLPQVALRGPRGALDTVDGRRVAMTLTWPWWSLEGSRGGVLLAALQTVGTPQ